YKKVQDLSSELIIKIEYMRWLLFRPKVLFILNPLSETDLNLQKIIIDMINYLHKNNLTVIIATTNNASIDKIKCKTKYIEPFKSLQNNL
ncbi:MAG: hypothetical protein PQJ46_13610, partial [Spirochaetales bacterium]|nr:hypothetical protein [Spirochaetales bacterium]